MKLQLCALHSFVLKAGNLSLLKENAVRYAVIALQVIHLSGQTLLLPIFGTLPHILAYYVFIYRSTHQIINQGESYNASTDTYIFIIELFVVFNAERVILSREHLQVPIVLKPHPIPESVKLFYCFL